MSDSIVKKKHILTSHFFMHFWKAHQLCLEIFFSKVSFGVTVRLSDFRHFAEKNQLAR